MRMQPVVVTIREEARCRIRAVPENEVMALDLCSESPLDFDRALYLKPQHPDQAECWGFKRRSRP